MRYQLEEQELDAELIGEGVNQRLMLWESAEGGTGTWERLVGEPAAFSEIAAEALRLCHFDPDTGTEFPNHDPENCAVACYECLLSYSNQMQHRFLDRTVINSFLYSMTSATSEEVSRGRSRDEQYEHLKGRCDTSLEKEFLEVLFAGGFNLPDRAQTQPTSEVYVQPDFYFERNGVPGVCVFIDGPVHDNPSEMENDETVRAQLEELGYRIVVIRYDEDISEQISHHQDIFGQGN